MKFRGKKLDRYLKLLQPPEGSGMDHRSGNFCSLASCVHVMRIIFVSFFFFWTLENKPYCLGMCFVLNWLDCAVLNLMIVDLEMDVF